MDDIAKVEASDFARSLALDQIPLALVLTDAMRDDNPIIYVNRAFETITGYAQAAAVGRNCRFLQGSNTNRDTVRLIAEKVAAGDEVTTDILNYRADGAPFWNRLHIMPLTAEDGTPRYFMGVQRQLGNAREASIAGGTDDQPLREITHRVKNHLAMIVSLIRMQARAPNVDPRMDYLTLARRVESLQLLYQEMSDSGVGTARTEQMALGAYLSRVVSAIASIGSGAGVRTNSDIDFMESSPERAAQLGLVLSEILTNAYQHAFSGRTHGLVEVRLKRFEGGARLQVIDDGNGIPEKRDWPESGSLGGRIVRSLVTGLGAKLSVDRKTRGTEVTVDIPDQRWD